MDRRGFFGRLAAAVLAGLARPLWMAQAAPEAIVEPRLMFHPDAFKLAAQDLSDRIDREALDRFYTYEWKPGDKILVVSGGRGYTFKAPISVRHSKSGDVSVTSDTRLKGDG